jgi:hypothetical protein
LPRHLSLALVAAITAWIMLAVVRRASPQRLVQRARDRMAAAIYEMRLFLDAPGRVLAAQGRLLAWIAVYLASLVPAALLLTPPLGLLYLHLEPRHGLAPLAAPATLVARIDLAPGIDGRAVTVSADDGLAITAPILYAEDQQALHVRLAVRRPGTHRIDVRAGESSVSKRIVADPRAAVVLPERTRGLAYLWSLGSEPPPGTDSIRAVSIPHPERPQSWLGLAIPWWLYWLGLATLLALLLARRRGVAL